jgi:hypothetical protein
MRSTLMTARIVVLKGKTPRHADFAGRKRALIAIPTPVMLMQTLCSLRYAGEDANFKKIHRVPESSECIWQERALTGLKFKNPYFVSITVLSNTFNLPRPRMASSASLEFSNETKAKAGGLGGVLRSISLHMGRQKSEIINFPPRILKTKFLCDIEVFIVCT